MKKKSDFKLGDLVLIYEGTETFVDGALAKILDRDPEDNSFIVAPLEAIFAENGDVSKLLKEHAKWVKTDNMKKLKFSKDTKVNLEKLVQVVGLILASGVIGFLVGYGL